MCRYAPGSLAEVTGGHRPESSTAMPRLMNLPGTFLTPLMKRSPFTRRPDRGRIVVRKNRACPVLGFSVSDGAPIFTATALVEARWGRHDEKKRNPMSIGGQCGGSIFPLMVVVG